jgi:hypothetical protein
MEWMVVSSIPRNSRVKTTTIKQNGKAASDRLHEQVSPARSVIDDAWVVVSSLKRVF